MKNIFTFSAAVLLSIQGFSQSGSGGSNTITTLIEIPLGSSNNVFSSATINSRLYTEPALNEIVLIRRDGFTGNDLSYDISKDGGINWTIDEGPLYTGSTYLPRYPQCGLVNPSGAANPDSAFLTFLSPLTGPAGWSGIVEGQQQIASGSTPFTVADTLNASDHHIPSGYMVTKQGVIWSVDAQFINDSTYNDALIVRKGVWDNSSRVFNYTEQLINAPVTIRPDGTRNYLGCNIAFSPDGQIGFVVMCAHHVGGTNQDSIFYPVVFRSSDAGQTWGSAIHISISGVDSVLNLGTALYTMGEQFDIAVDAAGNLHLFCSVLQGDNHWGGYAQQGTFGLFDISSFGSNQWKAQLISMPQTFQAVFGDGGTHPFVVEQNRPQVSIDSTASKLFFAWTETDTMIYGTTENFFPDLHIRGLDITTFQLTGEINVTSGSGTWGDGGCLFHSVSYYALTGPADYSIPVTICGMQNPPISTASTINFVYLSGVTISAGTFTQVSNPVLLGGWSGGFNPYFSGAVYFDENGNGIKDGTEINLSGQRIDFTPDQVTLFTNSNGEYYFYSWINGNHQISMLPLPNWTITSDSLSYTVADDTVNQSGLDFGINAIFPENELEISLTSWIPRCNWDVPFYISYTNTGSTVLSGRIVFVPDSATTFVSATPPPDAISGDTLFFNYSNLYPFTPPQLITVVLHLPNSPGDTLFTGSYIQMDSSGTMTTLDESNLVSIITCSYDPNDKSVSPLGILADHYTLFNDTLLYTIRFQNTGNDTAFTVVIRDTLDSSLDVSTFHVLGYSHEVSTTIFPGNIVEFRFDNILLPDSTTDLEGSNGFVQFRIQPLAGIVLPEIVENNADIYFDSNPPVQTNTVINTLVLVLPVSIPEREKLLSCVMVSPNPFHSVTTMSMDPSLVTPGSLIRIMDAMGKLVFSSHVGSPTVVIKRGVLSAGLYFYSVTDGKVKTCYGKIIIE